MTNPNTTEVETRSQEFSRLVFEYNEGERQNRAEAWNLIADFAVENAEFIRDALLAYVADAAPAPSDPHMEEARQLWIAALQDGTPDAAILIARALSAYEAKGRQDGVREGMKRAAEKAREYAAHYPEASDARNTFIIFAEWAEKAHEGQAFPRQSVKAKMLKWHGPDCHDEYYARSAIGNFNIGCARHDGARWCLGEWYPTLDEAKAAAQADFEARILSNIDEAK